MNYRNFTKRCPHGFAVGLIGCPECGTEVPDHISQNLRRINERRSAVPRVPPTYTARAEKVGRSARGWRE